MKGADAIIDEWREKIDQLDRRILELLNERVRCAIKIGRAKRALRQPIQAPERETEVIARALAENSGPLDDQAVRRVFGAIIAESRRLEARYSEGDGAEESR